jgi:hypothetical protein
MEKFEHFFKENRLRLDTENLDNESWANIENSLNKLNRRSLFRKMYVAASIIVILGLSFLLLLNQTSTETQIEHASIFSEISPDLAEQEESYIQMVNTRINKIKTEEVPKENAALFNEFIKQLEVIDKQYELYKQEIEKTGYNDELIQQIIYNYQLKLSVLQMLQSEIDKINRLSKKNNNEKRKIKLDI